MAQYEQCGMCGTYRKRGIEMLTHIQLGGCFRCPFCGMPAHNGHICHDDSRVSRGKDGIITRVPQAQP